MIEFTRKTDNQINHDSPIPTTINIPTTILQNPMITIEQTPQLLIDSTLVERKADVRKNATKSPINKQTSGIKESYEERIPTRTHRYNLRKNVKRVKYYDEANIDE